MTKLETLKNELLELQNKQDEVGKIWITIEDERENHKFYVENYKPLSKAIEDKEREIIREERLNVQIGDGVTICYYTDQHAATVIKRTAKSITVQRDKATLDPNFKPEFIAGGFAGHCVNQNEQTYTYERDPNGRIETYRWSEKYNSFRNSGDQSIKIINGRHEFYDYNF